MQSLTRHIGPLVMFAVGLGFALGAVQSLDLGSFRRLGPGAFPLLAGGLLCLLALVGLVQGLRSPAPVGQAELRADPLAVLGVLGGVAAFAFVTPRLGVLPGAALAVLVTGSVIRGFSWRHRVALAVGVALGVWLIFIQGLGLPLTALRGI